MFHIDNTSGVPVMPPVKDTQSSEPKYFTEGGSGQAPSWPGADWFNIVQSELLNILAESGITPSKTDLNQLTKAIRGLFSVDDGDQYVGSILPFEGAIFRTERQRNAELVSVKEFGAKGDGVTNDTAAFIAASTALPGGVYVPPGRYVLPNDITGKYFGPGRRLAAAGDTISIPFPNFAQSFGNLFWGYDAGKNYQGNDINGAVVGVGPGVCRNVSVGYNIVGLGVGVLTGDTLNDALTDTSFCTGYELIGIGYNALKKAITLHDSIGIGRDALNENKFGMYNIGIGSSAFQQMHTGSANVALGRAAGMRSGIVSDPDGLRLSYSVITGNTFIGNAAGRENQNGNYNTYLGNNSGRGETSTTNPNTGTSTGSYNVSVGSDALSKLTSASRNTVIGAGAARDMTTGSGGIFIGYLAGASITSGDNLFILGGNGTLPFMQGLMAGAENAANYLRIDAVLTPAADNTRALGSGNYRFTQVFAAAGAINTSDGRLKTEVSEPEEAEIRVAKRLKKLIRRYKFIDAVQEKRDDARWHFGVIAQDVAAAFADEGLDATKYGMFCHDTWETEYAPVLAKKMIQDPDTGIETEIEYDTGEKYISREAGDRYGIRYDELTMFILSAM